MQTLRHRLNTEAVCEIQKRLANKERFAVACSGGSDSVFLLLAAIHICGAENLLALHFNHTARENADNDEVFVAALCKKLNVECISGRPKNRLKKISEESLREARLAFFEDECRKRGINAVLQGHIKGDIAETILMRLIRGSGLEGLCAPRPVSQNERLTFIRPLLDIGKSEIQSALTKQRQNWVEDESNAQNDFLRNKIRNLIIPSIENSGGRDFSAAAARTRKLLEEDAKLIEAICAKEAKELSPFKIELSEFGASHAGAIRRSVQKLLVSAAIKLRSKSVDDFVKDCLLCLPARVSLKGGNLAYDPSKNHLTLVKDVKPKVFNVDLKFGENVLPNGSRLIVEEVDLDAEFFDVLKSGKVGNEKYAYLSVSSAGLQARSLAPKDAYKPIGAKSKRLIKDMMSAKKTEISKRRHLPLVCLGCGAVLWAPTLPPAESFKVKEQGRAIRLTYLD